MVDVNDHFVLRAEISQYFDRVVTQALSSDTITLYNYKGNSVSQMHHLRESVLRAGSLKCYLDFWANNFQRKNLQILSNFMTINNLKMNVLDFQNRENISYHGNWKPEMYQFPLSPHCLNRPCQAVKRNHLHYLLHSADNMLQVHITYQPLLHKLQVFGAFSKTCSYMSAFFSLPRIFKVILVGLFHIL